MSDHDALLTEAREYSPTHEDLDHGYDADLVGRLTDALEREGKVVAATLKHYSGLVAQSDAIIGRLRELLSEHWDWKAGRTLSERVRAILSLSPESALAEHDAEVKADAWDEGAADKDREWAMCWDLVTPDEDRFAAVNPYRERGVGA